MKKILLAIILLSPLALFAQEEAAAPAPADTTYWTNTFDLGLNFNQASFSSNWKAGGVNSIAFGGLLNAKASYLKDKTSWDNELEFQYGIVNNEGQGARKSADRIYLDSKYGHKLGKSWSIFGSLNFLTQFANGFRYENDPVTNLEQELIISRFMAPGFLTLAWGAEYKPNKFFSMRFSPFAPRFTFVTDNEIIVNEPTNYGVEAGKNVRQEWLAFQMQADFNKDIAKNINLKLRYLFFANYETFEVDAFDHRLDAVITAKVNDYINTNFTFNLLYDIDQDDEVQMAQALAIGFAYKLANRK